MGWRLKTSSLCISEAIEVSGCVTLCDLLQMPNLPAKAHPILGIITTILCVLNVSSPAAAYSLIDL